MTVRILIITMIVLQSSRTLVDAGTAFYKKINRRSPHGMSRRYSWCTQRWSSFDKTWYIHQGSTTHEKVVTILKAIDFNGCTVDLFIYMQTAKKELYWPRCGHRRNIGPGVGVGGGCSEESCQRPGHCWRQWKPGHWQRKPKDYIEGPGVGKGTKGPEGPSIG